MSKKGVVFEKGDPVERLSSEGPLDQNLGITVDHNDLDTVLLGGVVDEHDIFKRCPAKGTIDCDRGPADRSIEHCLSDLPSFMRDLLLCADGDELRQLDGGPRSDRFCVQDAHWLENPEQLAWSSALLAQLKARLNAVTYFLNDPSAADFTGTLSPEERKAIAERARSLSVELRDSAVAEMGVSRRGGEERYRQAVELTKERFLRSVVTQEDAVNGGGLTEAEVNELFEEVQS